MKPDNAKKTASGVEGLIELGQKDNCDHVPSLEYIFDMLAELRSIAKNIDQVSLVYYLEMAAMEAGDASDALKFRRDESMKAP